jgi:ELWxxDGT repeat protein
LAGTYFIGGGDTGFVQPTVVDDRVFFVGNVLGVEGNELFETAPGLSSTLLVRDINPLSDGGTGSLNSNPSDLTAFGHQLLFDADDGTNGRELWISDGTFAGTHMVKDIDAGSGSGVPGGVKPMITWNGLAFFTGYDADSTHGSNGAALWRTDGTEAGTYMLTDGFGGMLEANDGHTLNYMGPALTSDPEFLYFQSFDLGTNTFDLYKTDGNTFTQVAVTDGAYPPVALFDVPQNANVAPTDITIDDDTIDIDLAFSGFPIGCRPGSQ